MRPRRSRGLTPKNGNGLADTTVANGHQFCRFEKHRNHARERARVCVLLMDQHRLFFCRTPKAVSLPYAPSHHQSIKFSLSLSLLCLEITLLSLSLNYSVTFSRRSSRSFSLSQTLLSTFDSASSCVQISSRIAWIYRNRVKPPRP